MGNKSGIVLNSHPDADDLIGILARSGYCVKREHREGKSSWDAKEIIVYYWGEPEEDKE